MTRKEEHYRRNQVEYPNQEELKQIKHDKEVAEHKVAAEKPVTLAGFTKRDFQRVKQTLLVLHENKVTYNYLKLMLSEVQDWLLKFNSSTIPEDQLLEIMAHTIKLNDKDSERFISSLSDTQPRLIEYNYLKRFVDYYCYAPNTAKPIKNKTSTELQQAFNITDITDIRDSLHQARKDLLS
jgi:hypothetical protein